MPEPTRALIAMLSTLALLSLAAAVGSRAEEADEVGTFGAAEAPTRPAASAAPAARWLPRLRRAFDLDDDEAARMPTASTPATTEPPAGSASDGAPAANATSGDSALDTSSTARPAAGETSPAAPLREAPATDETELPPLTILPQPAADDKPAPSGYTRSIGEAVAWANKYGRRSGSLKLYAEEGAWGPPIKLQDCFGDNILTKFAVRERGLTERLWFQYRDASHRRQRWRWVMIDPGMVIRGRTIYLRAQSSGGSDIVALQVVGNCIDP